MKKTIVPILMFLCLSLSAQNYNVVSEVSSDWRKLSGMEGPHIFDEPERLTPSPKGYKPFYISHYGRHGSRTAWNSNTYKLLRDIFAKAEKDTTLTWIGQDFQNKYKTWYVEPLINAGDLVPLGFEQHKLIGQWVCENFPEVWKEPRRVDALVSTAQRSILSMSSFCLSLKGYNPGLDIYQSSNHAGMTVAAPTSAPSSLRRKFKCHPSMSDIELEDSFYDRTLDRDGIISRLFKDPEYVEKNYPGGKNAFCGELYMLLGGYRNYTDEPIFDNVVTPEHMLQLWECSNYSSFYVDVNSRYLNIPLLEDIIKKADEAIANPGIAANLRFGHDYVAEALMCLMNVNGSGTIPEKAEDVKYWFRNYDIPMACTTLLVFYKNKENDIIFKVVWNEKEATLPQLNPVSGDCYYSWNDFKHWAQGIFDEHPEI